MGQLLILENSDTDFTEKLNTMLKSGFHVVPGTSYIAHVQHNPMSSTKVVDKQPYFFAVLNSKEYQISISAMDSILFHRAVNDKLKTGFTVIPGTIYITTLETVYDKRLIEPVYSIIIERD